MKKQTIMLLLLIPMLLTAGTFNVEDFTQEEVQKINSIISITKVVNSCSSAGDRTKALPTIHKLLETKNTSYYDAENWTVWAWRFGGLKLEDYVKYKFARTNLIKGWYDYLIYKDEHAEFPNLCYSSHLTMKYKEESKKRPTYSRKIQIGMVESTVYENFGKPTNVYRSVDGYLGVYKSLSYGDDLDIIIINGYVSSWNTWK